MLRAPELAIVGEWVCINFRLSKSKFIDFFTRPATNLLSIFRVFQFSLDRKTTSMLCIMKCDWNKNFYGFSSARSVPTDCLALESRETSSSSSFYHDGFSILIMYLFLRKWSLKLKARRFMDGQWSKKKLSFWNADQTLVPKFHGKQQPPRIRETAIFVNYFLLSFPPIIIAGNAWCRCSVERRAKGENDEKLF